MWLLENMPKSRDLLLRGHVWLLATLIPLLVKLIPLKKLIVLLTPPVRFRPYRGISADRIVELVRRRLRAPRNMRRRACLREGVTLFHFLRLTGRPAIMHFGVFPPSTDPLRMHAHCWVTLDGRAVSSPPEQPHATVLVYGHSDQAAS